MHFKCNIYAVSEICVLENILHEIALGKNNRAFFNQKRQEGLIWLTDTLTFQYVNIHESGHGGWWWP